MVRLDLIDRLVLAEALGGLQPESIREGAALYAVYKLVALSDDECDAVGLVRDCGTVRWNPERQDAAQKTIKCSRDEYRILLSAMDRVRPPSIFAAERLARIQTEIRRELGEATDGQLAG